MIQTVRWLEINGTLLTFIMQSGWLDGNKMNFFSAKKLPLDVNPKGVFACNELDLKEVQVYGFDYDYTLACYKPSMDYLLYSLGRDMLIQKYKVYKDIRRYVMDIL